MKKFKDSCGNVHNVIGIGGGTCTATTNFTFVLGLSSYFHHGSNDDLLLWYVQAKLGVTY